MGASCYSKFVKETCHARRRFLKNKVEQLRKERGLNQDDLQKCFVFQDKPLVQSKQESIIHHWN